MDILVWSSRHASSRALVCSSVKPQMRPQASTTMARRYPEVSRRLRFMAASGYAIAKGTTLPWRSMREQSELQSDREATLSMDRLVVNHGGELLYQPARAFHSQARTMKREARFTTSRARANVCKIARNMKRELYPQPESLHDNHAATATNNNHHRHFQHAAWPPTWLSHMPHAGAKCTTMVPQTASNPPPTVLHQLQHQRRFDIRACYI